MSILRRMWGEYGVAIIVGLVFLSLITLPYIYAAQKAGEEYVFGGFLFNPLDGNSYLAKMYEGWRGDWTFTLPYTAEKGEGTYLNLFYILSGHLAFTLRVGLTVSFHVSRILASIIMLVTLYWFYKNTLRKPHQHKIAFAMAIFGGGLGWLALFLGVFTADFWIAEAYPFLSAFANPHFSLGLALILFLFMPVEKKPNPWLTVTLIMVAIVLALISPFGVVIVSAVLFSLILWDYVEPVGKSSYAWFKGRLVIVLLTGAPILLYDLWVTRSDTLLSIWNEQNVTISPPVWDTLVSMSPVILLAVPGIWKAYQQNTSESRLLISWVLLGLIFMYLPFGLQRRFMLGMYVPLAGLAIMGIDHISDKYLGKVSQVRKRRFMIITLFVLIVPTNLLVLLASLNGIQSRDANLYLTRGESEALVWIKDNSLPDALILSSPEMGMFIPAHTGRRVIYGHPFETVNASINQEAVEKFFRDDVIDMRNFIDEYSVDYIFLGPREQNLSNSSDRLMQISELDLVYQSDDVTLFTVKR